MEAFVASLRRQYGDGAVVERRDGPNLLVRVSGVPIPSRTSVSTDVLVVLTPDFRLTGARPPVYFKPGITQPNGRPGRNVNPALVGGEAWLSASWQFEWNPSMPAWTLVEGAARRFAINED